MQRELKAGVILNYLSIGLNLAMGLLLTPIIITKLGMTEYGLFMLSNSIIAWLGLTDFGLGATVTRYVIFYQARRRFNRQAYFLGQVILLFSVLGLAALGLGVAGFYHLRSLLPEADETQLHLLRILYIITLSNFVLSFPLRPLAAMPSAYRRFLVPGIAGLVQALLNIGLTLPVLWLGGRAVALTLLAFALNMGLMLWQVGYAFRSLGARVIFRWPDWKLYRSMFGFSFWVMLNQLMDLLYWQIGTPIVARVCGPQAVALYTLGISFTRYFMTLSTAISGVAAPEVMHRAAQHQSPQELTGLMIRVGRWQLCILGILLSGFCLFGRDFLQLWVGSSIGSATTQVWLGALAVLLPLMLPLIQNTGIAILQAAQLHHGRAVILLISAMVCLIPGYLLTVHYGPTGMFCGTALSLLLGHGLLLNLYYSRRAGLDMQAFFREVCYPVLLPLGICLAGGWAIPVFLRCNDWYTLLSLGGGYAIFATLVFYLLYLRRDERAVLFSLFRK